MPEVDWGGPGCQEGLGGTLSFRFGAVRPGSSFGAGHVRRGMVGGSKSLKDDRGMVIADGHLEEDRHWAQTADSSHRWVLRKEWDGLGRSGKRPKAR